MSWQGEHRLREGVPFEVCLVKMCIHVLRAALLLAGVCIFDVYTVWANSSHAVSSTSRAVFDVDHKATYYAQVTKPTRQSVSTSNRAGEKGKVLLEWEEVQGASGYYVEIASDTSFEKILFSKTIMTTSLQWNFDAAGSYYFHVATINAQGQMGAFTEVTEIKLAEPPVKPGTPIPVPRQDEALKTATPVPAQKPPVPSVRAARQKPTPVISSPKVKPAARKHLRQSSPPAEKVSNVEATKEQVSKPVKKSFERRCCRGTSVFGFWKPTLWQYHLTGLPVETKLDGMVFNAASVQVESQITSALGVEAGYSGAGTKISADEFETGEGSLGRSPVFLELNRLYLGVNLQRDIFTTGTLSVSLGLSQLELPVIWESPLWESSGGGGEPLEDTALGSSVSGNSVSGNSVSGSSVTERVDTQVKHRVLRSRQVYIGTDLHLHLTPSFVLKPKLTFEYAVADGSSSSPASSAGGPTISLLAGTDVVYFPSTQNVFWGGGIELTHVSAVPKDLVRDEAAKMVIDTASVVFFVGWRIFPDARNLVSNKAHAPTKHEPVRKGEEP